MAQWRRRGGLELATLLVYVFLYAPIVVLVIFSFNRSRLSGRWLGLTGEWYATLAGNQQIFSSLFNSLVIGLASTAACVIFGTLAAVVFARRRLRHRGLLDAVIYMPLLIPEIVMAVALVLTVQLEGNMLNPYILGKAVSIHPLAILLAVTGGTILGGVFGAFIAVPLVAVLNNVRTTVRLDAAAVDG